MRLVVRPLMSFCENVLNRNNRLTKAYQFRVVSNINDHTEGGGERERMHPANGLIRGGKKE